MHLGKESLLIIKLKKIPTIQESYAYSKSRQSQLYMI
jgi:hypothetical protein